MAADTARHTALVIIPHADDLAFFCSGRVATWAEDGWRVVVVRVTNDDKDSLGLSKEDTVRRNTAEFQEAARILGVAETVELGYVTDTLGDVSLVDLREKIIRLVRTHRPYAIMSFDQYGVLHEDNQDHIVVAKAVDEAVWTSMFDKHHPEHLAEGLQPHGVFERWWFARRLQEVTEAVDISAVLDKKVAAVRAHETMVRHIIHQLRMQAATGGYEVPALDAAAEGDYAPLVEMMIRSEAADAGERHGLDAAEEYRMVRFGGMEELLPDTPNA